MVRVRDHTGWVEGCDAHSFKDLDEDRGPLAANASSDLTRLNFTWSAGSWCDPTLALLELWPRHNDQIERLDLDFKPYLLAIRPVPASGNEGCTSPRLLAHSVDVTLTAPLRASDIELLTIGFGTTTRVVTETAAGSVQLELSSTSPLHLEGEPVDLAPVLHYLGPDEAATLYGSSAGITRITAEELNGDLYFGPAVWHADCGQQATVERDEPFVDERTYESASRLDLPRGRWLVTAHSSFRVGGCEAGSTELRASVIIEVARSYEWHVVDCGLHAAVEIIDTIGLVTGCEPSQNEDPDTPISIDNPEGDETKLRIHWLGESCGGSTTIHLLSLPDRVAVLVRPSTYRGCDGFQFRIGLTLDLVDVLHASGVEPIRSVRVLDPE